MPLQTWKKNSTVLSLKPTRRMLFSIALLSGLDAKNYDEILVQYLEKKYGEDKANK